MNGKHWTDQNFIDHIYGIGPDGAHLEVCPDCRSRSVEFLVRRRTALPEQDVSAEFLAEQRRSIHHRLEQERQPRRVLAPALAASAAVILGLLLLQPAEETYTPLVTSATDSQLFSDIYALEESSEPSALQPIQALFEEN